MGARATSLISPPFITACEARFSAQGMNSAARYARPRRSDVRAAPSSFAVGLLKHLRQADWRRFLIRAYSPQMRASICAEISSPSARYVAPAAVTFDALWPASQR